MFDDHDDYDDCNDDESLIYLMFDGHQPIQLCGPDGGFTSAGRDSLLFQVKTLSLCFFASFYCENSDFLNDSKTITLMQFRLR